jgi:hypothetical protein
MPDSLALSSLSGKATLAQDLTAESSHQLRDLVALLLILSGIILSRIPRSAICPGLALVLLPL